MELLPVLLQVIVALGIFNVWLVRPKQASAYRGGHATTLQGEFAAYGLPVIGMYVIGAIKLSLAAALIVGIWVPAIVLPAALGLAVMMLGAIAMHWKIGDRPAKSLPAALLLVMCLAIAFL